MLTATFILFGKPEYRLQQIGGTVMKTYKCQICGHVFTVEEGVTPECPICGVGEDMLEEVKGE